ncbi:MAG: metal ABC transporter substrate-binding protein [Actinomycetota bacterium]|nr:metal ABC transporter substrate-binding protein [Actinomycetota bacterium]
MGYSPNGRSPIWVRVTVFATVATLLLAACGDDTTDDTATISVVATTTILGDIARNVVGDNGTVEVLMPIGADPHDYQASSRQIASLQTADLVIINGLNLEEGLDDVLDSLDGDGANILEITSVIDTIPFGDADADCNMDPEPPEGTCDPHVWLDPGLMADAARAIAAELRRLDQRVDWGSGAEHYASELLAADAKIRSILEAIPSGNHKMVTSHLAFGYFAARYGFEVIGVVIPGGSTLAEPSSGDLAALVDKIKAENVPAIFADITESSDLAEAVAAEVGSEIAVIDLYTGSLGEEGSGADTLIGMLVTNAERIAKALS